MKSICHASFDYLVSIENLLEAWQDFLPGKKKKKDVQEFQLHLMDNILALHKDLINGTYRHGGYQEFKINDPKPRVIHKATVRDRLLHHAIYRILYPFFEETFITDSFSCRVDKGTHRALKRFKAFSNIVSKNNTKTCWILKCDIRKFFHSIDQTLLLSILDKRIADKRIVGLLKEVIASFKSVDARRPRVGLPLGNLTSQLFSNVYLNEFDRFVKHDLRVKYYIRYADDFVIFSAGKEYLQTILAGMQEFLQQELKLTIHPDKIFIKTLAQGMDFLGWVHFFDHRVLRTKTKKRMFANLRQSVKPERLNSYLVLLKHGNGQKVREKMLNLSDLRSTIT